MSSDTQLTNKLIILRHARILVSKSNSFTFVLARILIPSRKRSYFYCWYSYLRWVDDIADLGSSSHKEKSAFIAKQIQAIKEIYRNNTSHEFISRVTPQIVELIEYDLNNGNILEQYIINMLECIRFDVNRAGNGLTTSLRLNYYFKQEVLAYLNAFQYFACPIKYFFKVNESPEGLAGKITHILRDFIKDIEENIYNISIDDYESIALDRSNAEELIKSNPFIYWVKKKVSEAEANFRLGLNNLKDHPNLKYKILVVILCFKYKLYLNKIKKDHFNLRKVYELSKMEIIIRIPFLFIDLTKMSFDHVSKFRKRKTIPSNAN